MPSLSPPLSFSPLTMTVIPAVYELLDICSSILARSTLTRAPQPLLRLHLEPAREDDPFALNSQTGALVLYQPPQWGFPCVNELLHYPCEPELVEVSRKVTNIFPDLRRLLLSGPFPCLIPTAPTPSLDSRTGALILYTPPLSATFVQVFNDEDEPTYEVSPLVTEVFSIILLSAGSLVGSTLLLGFPVNSPKISAQPSLDLILMIARKERQFCCYHSMALVIYSPLVWFPPISTKALSATKLPPQIIELTLMLARKFIEQKQTRNAQETIIEAQPIEPEVKTPRPRIRPVPRSLFLRNIVVNQQKSNNKPASPFTPIKASCPQSSPTTANRERPMAKLPLSGGVRLGIVSSPNPNKKKENGDAPTPQAAKPNPMPQPISSRSKRKKATATPSRK